MNVILWILQVLLAVMFTWHGNLFLFPPADAADALNSQFPGAFRVFLGVAELAAAVGLILPGITRILPKLIALAAAGLLLVTVSATGYHLWRGEASTALFTAVLSALIGFVGYMRWRILPVLARKQV